MPRGKQTSVSFGEKAGISLLEVLAGGQGIVADKVIACLARADRQSLGLACKALQHEVAARWRRLSLSGLPAAVLRSKLLPKLRSVEELCVFNLQNGAVQDFYRLLLALNRNGARVKIIVLGTAGLQLLHPLQGVGCPLQGVSSYSGQLPAEQPQDLVMTTDSLRQLEPLPHLELLSICALAPVDAALLQPLLRAPALKTAELQYLDRVYCSILDFSACNQLQKLSFSIGEENRSSIDIFACLQGLRPAPCLKILGIENFKVDSEFVRHISSSLPALEYICMQRCPVQGPADAGAGQELLQPSLANLKELELGYDRMTIPSDLALQQLLLSAATSLKKLLLAFPGPHLPHLPLDNPGLAQLEELSINMGGNLDGFIVFEGDLLRQVAKYQRRLRELRMRIFGACLPLQLHPQQVTTQDVQAFLDAAPPGLQLLRLHGFAHVQPSFLVLPAAACGLKLDIVYPTPSTQNHASSTHA